MFKLRCRWDGVTPRTIMICESCSAVAVEWHGDVTERFAFVEEALGYHDGPVHGLVRCRTCGCPYVFSVFKMVDHLLWHWSLVPIASEDIAQCITKEWDELFAFARSRVKEKWLSMTEDRRDRNHVCIRAHWISTAIAQPRL